jgi:hypothetical protein
VDLLQPVAGSLQQPDLVLAEGQDEEVAVAGQQGQQWADVEPVGHHRQLGKVQGDPQGPPPPRAAVQGQAVALVLPEQAVVHQPPQRRQDTVDHRRPDPIGLEGLGGLAQQVLEPDRGLPDLGSGATGGQEQRDGRSRALEHEALQIGSTDQIHGEPPYIQASTCSLAGSTLAEAVQRRLCAEQLGLEGFEDRLGPDVQPCPVLASRSRARSSSVAASSARRTVSTSSRV